MGEKTHNSLLILTFDERRWLTPTNQIPTIFYGANVRQGSYGEAVNHYRVLRTIEDVCTESRTPAMPRRRLRITDCWTTGGSGGASGSGGSVGAQVARWAPAAGVGSGGASALAGWDGGSSTVLSRWRLERRGERLL